MSENGRFLIFLVHGSGELEAKIQVWKGEKFAELVVRLGLGKW